MTRVERDRRDWLLDVIDHARQYLRNPDPRPRPRERAYLIDRLTIALEEHGRLPMSVCKVCGSKLLQDNDIGYCPMCIQPENPVASA